jgi:hypothetical protein
MSWLARGASMFEFMAQFQNHGGMPGHNHL